MFKRTRLISVLVGSFLAFMVFFSGFMISQFVANGKIQGNTLNTIDSSSVNSNSITKDSGTYNILVMGDSLAKGTGDENGKGFAKDFADIMKAKTKKEVLINNIAVNSVTSTVLLKTVNSEDTASKIQNANIILISIGGNDIIQYKNSPASSLKTKIINAKSTYLDNLKKILGIIRSTNKNCTIALIGLYNPFGENVSQDMVKLLSDWNYGTEQLLSQDSNSIFIPTYDLFRYNLKNYLTIDNFHPNSAGYDAISKRIVEALKYYN